MIDSPFLFYILVKCYHITIHTAMHKTNDKSTATLCIYIKVPSIMTVGKGFKVPNELLGQIQHTRNPHKVESNLSVEIYTLLAS